MTKKPTDKVKAPAESTKSPKLKASAHAEDKATAATSTKEKKVAKTVSKKPAVSAKPGRMNGKACQVKSCKREYRAKGYCKTHYKMWRHGSYGRARFTPCSDTGCFTPQALNRHGYCEPHFQNYYVKGMDVPKVAAAAPAAEVKKAS